MKLPYDILYHIVYLLQDDQDDLASLCHVSRLFHSLASRYLYLSPLFSSLHGFLSFAKHLTPANARYLQRIDLQSVYQRDKFNIGSSLVKIASLRPPLTLLDLESCRFKAEDLASCMDYLPSITHVNMTQGYFVSNEVVEVIAGGWPLVDLKLSSTLITNEAFHFLRPTSIQRLWIDDCPILSEEGLFYLEKHVPSLKCVVARHCTNIVLSSEDEARLKTSLGLIMTDSDYKESQVEDLFDASLFLFINVELMCHLLSQSMHNGGY
ncbi:hypothetical protein BDF14DRAFT_962411 [Spinellus fusiger]|nr:hypothetical protein BDF14DRAFT_962411 [Spinellus fusiger]